MLSSTLDRQSERPCFLLGMFVTKDLRERPVIIANGIYDRVNHLRSTLAGHFSFAVCVQIIASRSDLFSDFAKDTRIFAA